MILEYFQVKTSWMIFKIQKLKPCFLITRGAKKESLVDNSSSI
jgi:hypothetical protein